MKTTLLRACAFLLVGLTAASAALEDDLEDGAVIDDGADSRSYTFMSPMSVVTNRQGTSVNVNSEQFPDIQLHVAVIDASGNSVTGMTQGAFTVCEQSETETNVFQETITSFSEALAPGGISVSLVFDVSGSMATLVSGQGNKTRLDLAKEAAIQFINNSGQNDRVNLVTFSYLSRVTLALPSDWVGTDANGNGERDIITAIKAMRAGGGTYVYDGTAKGIESLSQEPTPKAVIVFTDGETSEGNYKERTVIDFARANAVPLYTIGLGLDPQNLKNMAAATGGTYAFAPTPQEMAAIYAAIATKLRSQYTISYTSHNRDFDGTTRQITVKPTGHPNGYGVYKVNDKPEIVMHPATLALAGASQAQGVALTIVGTVIDRDAHTAPGQSLSATLYYRHALSADYSAKPLSLAHNGVGSYAFSDTIPAGTVGEPAVHYYVTATDGLLSIADPQFFNTLPHIIPVLNNHAPQITHTPVTTAPEATPLVISADIIDVDSGDFIREAVLYVRTRNPAQRTPYFPLPMANTIGNTFEATVPADRVTYRGLEYFISARDRGLVRSDNGTAVAPHVVEVPPVADFSYAPATGLVPLAVAFTNLSSGTVLLYEWDFDSDGVPDMIDPGPSFTHTYTVPGTYSVTLTAIGPGATATRVQRDIITVTYPAPIPGFAGSPLSGDFPLTVDFTSTAAGVFNQVNWDFDNNGSTDASDGRALVTHTYPGAGLFSVKQTVSGPGGVGTLVLTNYVNVTTPPAPATAFRKSASVGIYPLDVVFENMSSGRIDVCIWDFDGDGSGDLTNNTPLVQYTYTRQGAFNATLTCIGPGGTTAVSALITVNHPPPVADFSADQLSGNFPRLITFQNQSSGIFTNSIWHFGEGANQTINSGPVQHSYASSGAYNVSLTVQGPGGQHTLVRNAYINISAPPAPTGDFMGFPLSGIVPHTVTFSSQSTGVVTTSAWDFDGNGSTDNSTANGSVSFEYTNPGTYTVRLTLAGPGGSNVITKVNYVTVRHPAPAGGFTVSPGSGIVPLLVTFTNQSAGTIDNVSWDFYNDGSIDLVDNGPTVQHTYTNVGVFDVRQLVEGPGGTVTVVRASAVTTRHPAPVASFTKNSAGGDYPHAVTFTSTSSGPITSYRWDFDGDGLVDAVTASPAAFSYTRADVFTPRLTVIGPGGSSSATDTVTITEPAPTANFTANSVGGQAPHLVSFQNTSSGLYGTCLWDFTNDGTNDLASCDGQVNYRYMNNGLYSVRLTVIGPGGTHSIVKPGLINVTVPAPVAGFTASPVEGLSPLQVTFADLATGSITNRHSDLNGDRNIDFPNPTIAQLVQSYGPGNHSVVYKVQGPGGESIARKHQYILVNQTNRAPTVAVCGNVEFIFLTNITQKASIDASCSSDLDGDVLYFSWRESALNPVRGLIPVGSDSLSQLNLYFPSPGQYVYAVRVSDGVLVSDTKIIQVFVPGLRGEVLSAPSDLITVPDARIEVYANYADASNRVNIIDATISNSRGEYTLEKVVPGAYTVRVDRDGFETLFRSGLNVSPQPGFVGNDTDLSIYRGFLSSGIAGIVTDLNGQPLNQVTVSVVPGIGGQVFFDTSGVDGRWSIGDPDQGMWVVQFSKTGYQSTVREMNLDQRSTNIWVRLAPTVGLADFCVETVLNGTEFVIDDARIVLGDTSERATDSNGQYTFTDIAPGFYKLQVRKDGYEPFRQNTIQIQPGSNSLRVALTPKGTMIWGDVTDATSSELVDGAQVAIELKANELLSVSDTDHTGYYVLRDVIRGTNVNFRVTAKGYMPKTFTAAILDNSRVNISLTRDAQYAPRAKPHPDVPVAGVPANKAFLFLPRANVTTNLDASASTGSNLSYIWHQSPSNPERLNMGIETDEPFNPISPRLPGIYVFEVRVSDGHRMSPNRAAITVFVPGLAGNVHESPTDGLEGEDGAEVRLYNNYAHALAAVNSENPWSPGDPNVVESALALPVNRDAGVENGDFVFDNINTGCYWVVAEFASGSYKRYGPVMKVVNYSSAAGKMPLNLERRQFRYEGKVVDQANTNIVIEGVRIVAAPGHRAEFFRTTTDATGGYRLPGVPQGSQFIAIYGEGYESSVIGSDVQNHLTSELLGLRKAVGVPSVSISGTVSATYKGTNTGQSVTVTVPNAEVILAGFGSTFADANGRYSFKGLPAGAYYGFVRRDGFIPTKLFDSAGPRVLANPASVTQNVTLQIAGEGPVLDLEFLKPGQTEPPGVVVVGIGGGGNAFFKNAGGGGQNNGDLDLNTATPASTAAVSSGRGGLAQLSGVPFGVRSLVLFTPEGEVVSKKIAVQRSQRITLNPESFAAPTEYENWRQDSFTAGGAADAAVSGENADPDGDGRTNREEFIANTDPLDGTSVFNVDLGSFTRTNSVFVFPASKPGRVYDVLWKSSLFDSTWQHFGYDIEGNGQDVTIDVLSSPNRSQIFMRSAVRPK